MASSSSQPPPPPPMEPIEPQPTSSPSTRAPYFPPPPAELHGPPGPPPPAPGQGLALQVGPDHPGSATSIPTVPGHTLTPMVPPAALDVRNIKASAQFHLGEFLRVRGQLQQQQQGGGAARFELESRLRSRAGMALGDLSTLQAEVRALAKAAEGHRWRRFLVGGAIAAFIPAVRKIFRRNSDEESQLSSNDTEYAFRKSKGLLSGIKRAILGGGVLAKVAFFVFAILYVFQNEVTIRVARTLNKRLRMLAERLEAGDPDMNEGDLRVFDGWRWRVLLW
ncbi:uncharacterized protein MAM_03051 [Metarhizium album ARSEF 1941]|uniref:Uncharacterized protein n=1 Tax=Metarhizium album (strain ARSEF 1941) TaxID=1081103 RepID=A0A0B2WZ99_METAS|nr:uncharacterized protein MAM_03051 [Metarhizium album ARSEF 1941]KHN99353.1 hypothetical protein MAM_03051 [Metarhizium album ARSEF 1941]